MKACDAHLPAIDRAQQRERLIDAGHQHRPVTLQVVTQPRGTDSTHWCTSQRGQTWSIRCAVVCTIFANIHRVGIHFDGQSDFANQVARGGADDAAAQALAVATASMASWWGYLSARAVEFPIRDWLCCLAQRWVQWPTALCSPFPSG